MYKLPQVEVRLKICEASPVYGNTPLDCPECVTEYLRDFLADRDREYLIVINCDSKRKPINFNVVSIGGIQGAYVDVANVFKAAILQNASYIILSHNHPSGDVTPSREDIEVTKRIKEAGEILGITLTDHIIIGQGYYSFMENGML